LVPTDYTTFLCDGYCGWLSVTSGARGILKGITTE
jgi:hypothetical protein